jgi:PAS domain S-box-containing protein
VFHILQQDGKSILVRSRIQVQRDSDGTPIKAFGILQDLTHEATIDAKIRASESALKEAQRIAKIGSWSHNLETEEYEWSDEMFRIAGIPRQKITQKLLLGLVHPDDLPRLSEASRASMEGEEFINLELRIQRPDGAIRFIQDRWQSIKNSDGKEIHRFGTIQDITEKKNAELERLKLERRILETEKLESLGLLAGGIAHDFNNLLAGILGNAELLLTHLPKESPKTEFAQGILRNAEAAADLVKNLLDFAGKRKGKSRPLNMKEVIENTLSLIKPLIPPHVQIQFESKTPLPLIQGDPLRMRQVLMNLLLNGAEALGPKPGNLWVRVQQGSSTLQKQNLEDWDKCIFWEKDFPLERALVIEVEDEGEGMDQETLEKIYEPFFTTKFTGHGLGLASTLDIIRSHSGQICVRSKKGEGSLFRILLPIS